jgi:hypothetical protein
MATGVFCEVVTLWPFATGGRLVTEIVINAEFVPPLPSLIV